ncbi:cysteine-rich CWC family protein [Catalinimonas niigatensis]|uniref:cysteine-rich CWC family protein n=1 Tax=Catalinimonas niigatensis TaxID=1397264 RepID=UPI0026663FBA|nr:cysteine-rich CWC family protein [Catalinimonas niigatensis]WPP50404.1 cysteine-rich CWC family protein [Catalinimonas niigatensis]
MSKHETKYCPICKSAFECKPGNITQCQCFGIPIDGETAQYIREKYEACLCRSCLEKLRINAKSQTDNSALDYDK